VTGAAGALVRGAYSGLRVVQLVVTGSFAGSERYAVNLAAGLARLGAEVTLVGGSPSRAQAALAGAGAEVAHLPATDVFEAWRRLRSVRRPDLVHAHLTAAEVAATIAFPSRSGVKVVSTRHIAARRGSSLPGRLASHWVRARLDGQLAPSEYVAARVDGACRVVPTGVAEVPLGSHESRVVIVAQRLEPEKDTATALRAWAASGLAGEDWELRIAGGGKEEGALRALAMELGVESSCRFLGEVADLAVHFAEAGLMLATATGEPFGLSVVEAMATGLPVVATAAGGHLETVAPTAGAVLFPPGDHELAARQLRALAGEPERRRAYGEALRERQRREYSLEAWVPGVAAWYVDVLGAPKAEVPVEAGRAT
jgi:glycosyltransferase involved in cell wall biosynthesis